MKRMPLVFLCVAILMAGPVLGSTPAFSDDQLYYASLEGRIDEVRRLLKAGADVNFAKGTFGGQTVLHAAVRGSHLEIARLLLDSGAKVRIQDESGMTVLHWAVRTKEENTEMARLLLNPSYQYKTVPEKLVDEIFSDSDSDAVQRFLAARDNDGNTALRYAVDYKNPKMVRLLLDFGANANVGDADDLISAVGNWEPSYEIVQLLLDAGADVYAASHIGENALGLIDRWVSWPSPLRPNSLDIARLLLGGDADMDVQGALQKQFELYSGCRPMDIVVALQNEDKSVQGLAEDDIQAALESRLRSARLYDSGARNTLYFYAHLMETSSGWAYSTDISFNKSVLDKASGISRHRPTWERGSLGVAPDVSIGEAILGNVRGYMDQFLAEYLRANENACE